VYLVLFPTGIAITHFYRLVLKKLKALSWKLYNQMLLIIISSTLKGVLLYLLLAVFFIVLNLSKQEISFLNALSNIINFSVVFFIWNTIYFGYHYFVNYKYSEINNLRLESAGKESELNSLKTQLNPHFMFNSMNSIRALIDENPDRAKDAVTRLSNILRNSLLMNKNKEITLKDEISLVKDYLELEKIRYEERLQFILNIDPQSLNVFLPPLIIQSQIENAIKHGISKLPKGGEVVLTTQIVSEKLLVTIINSGKLSHEKPETGLGFINSVQRLQLMYGKMATLVIKDNIENNKVITELQIPLKTN